MSSTKRNKEQMRHIADYYITPKQCIKDFFDRWVQDCPIPDKTIFLDPCAGGDDNNDMSYPSIIREVFGTDTTTIDIREDSKAEYIKDYLNFSVRQNHFDIIITNPPFNLALPIIRKALSDVRPNGYVVMLLRLNFLGSKDRFNFWKENMPSYIYVHHKRMSFTPDNKTDSIEYAHFVFQKGQNPKHAKLSII